MGKSETKKNKHLSLSIRQKVNLLQKRDCCGPMRGLSKGSGVETTPGNDLKKQKAKLLKFYSESDDHRLMYMLW